MSSEAAVMPPWCMEKTSWIPCFKYISSSTLRYAQHFSGNVFFYLKEKLTMEIEDKESTCREVAVELDKNLIESAVGWLEGCVATENPQLWVALLWAVPGRRKKMLWNYITTCDPAIKLQNNTSKLWLVWENRFTSECTVRMCWLLNKGIALQTSLDQKWWSNRLAWFLMAFDD